MKTLIVGARGRTGRHLVQEALRAGMQVRAMSRGITAEDVPPGVEVFQGDVTRRDDVFRAVDGVQVVFVALSMVRASDNPWAKILTPRDLHVQAARHLTEACEAHGVRRYLTVSAHGVGPSAPRAGWAFLSLVRLSNIGVAYANLAEAEKVVCDSALDWTIVRPTRLTNEDVGCPWSAATDLVTYSNASIARTDLARFLLHAVRHDEWIRDAVSVTSRR